MNETPKDSTPVQTGPQAKKEYNPPELRDYGTLRDLTRAGTGRIQETAIGAPLFSTVFPP